MNTHVVIMAGGIGTRLWPVSTPETPKQFIDLLGVGKSLIQLTVERFLPVCDSSRIWVVTSERYVDVVREQLPQIPVDQILAEPVPRNTAPCIAYACWKIMRKDPDANIVVTPSDALVLRTGQFADVIRKALNFTAENDCIVTVGIHPDRPETGYGYICSSSVEEDKIVKVNAFKEKPKRDIAEQYLAAGNYFWNAGIFIWSVSTIVNAFRVYQPAIAKIFENLMPVYGTADEQQMINAVYPECENISVDYAIMERVEEIFVCPADFGWSDLGTWGSLQMQTKHDLYGNTLIGEKIEMYESHNCVVHTLQQKQVVIQGLDNYIVAEKDGVLLICKLSEEQRIRQFSGEG